MRIHVLQHVPFEGPAAIGHWAAERGFPLTLSRLFAHEPMPPLDDVDLLVVLGGPMSVNDEARFDWLAPEKRCLQHAVADGKRVLGICLGAQLVAHVLGARVFPNPGREVGWWPVHSTDAAASHPLTAHWPREFVPLHWHGETFDLPSGAVWLARSAACAHQAFAMGNRVLALQFHLESTIESVDALARHCPGDLAPGECVQSAVAMLAQTGHVAQANQLLWQTLEALAACRD
jgi:GMP synthase-like glutamine amidotransferase